MKVIYENIYRVRYDVEFSIINPNVIQLIGIIPLNTSGFKIYRDDYVLLGRYADYTKIYRTVSGGYQYSNDGSVWVEPVVVVPDPEEPEEPIGFQEPSVSERVELCEACLVEVIQMLFA